MPSSWRSLPAVTHALVAVFEVPRDGAFDAVGERGLRLEAEPLARAADVELPARLAVGLRRIPRETAGESGRLGDHRGELADRDLVAGAEVDRVARVVALARQDQPLGGVLDV